MDQVGVYDDSKVEALTVSHKLGIMPAIFEPKWGADVPGKARNSMVGHHQHDEADALSCWTAR